MNPEQSDNLERVHAAIGPIVLRFCADRLLFGGLFRADELRDYVAESVPTAPASSDRILRQLKQEGAVDYEVVNRRGSLYRVLSVTGKEDARS